MDQESLNRLAQKAVDSAVAVHRTFDPGLLESAYEACLAYELRKRGLQIETQLTLPIVYDGQRVEAGYRIDILVERNLILEIKAVESLAPIHRAQLLSYLKLSKCRLGLLMNFNVKLMKDEIVRIANGL